MTRFAVLVDVRIEVVVDAPNVVAAELVLRDALDDGERPTNLEELDWRGARLVPYATRPVEDPEPTELVG